MSDRLVKKGPYLRGDEDTRTIMLDMLVALSPSLVWGAYVFGMRVLVIVALSAASFLLADWGMRRLLNKGGGFFDLSTLVSAVIFSMVLPPSVPFHLILLGAVLAVVLFRHLLGLWLPNVVNPVLGSLTALFLLFSGDMTRLIRPFTHLSAFAWSLPNATLDAVTARGNLSYLKEGVFPPEVGMTEFLTGNVAGGIGMASVLLLLTGGLYLLVRRVISFSISFFFVSSAALCFSLWSPVANRLDFAFYQLLSGGLILGATAFAGDPSTTPVTRWGKVVFGILCGVLTACLRLCTPLLEGVGIAVLVLSLFSRPLDFLLRPRVYGKERDLLEIPKKILSYFPKKEA